MKRQQLLSYYALKADSILLFEIKIYVSSLQTELTVK